MIIDDQSTDQSAEQASKWWTGYAICIFCFALRVYLCHNHQPFPIKLKNDCCCRSLKIPHHLSLGRSVWFANSVEGQGSNWKPLDIAIWLSTAMLTHRGSKKCVFSSESFPCGIRIQSFISAKTPIVVSSRLWVFCLNRRRNGSLTLVSIFCSRWWESCNTTIHHIYHIYKPTVFRRPSPPKIFPTASPVFFLSPTDEATNPP